MSKEVALTTAERSTMACALSLMITHISLEDYTEEQCMIATVLILSIIDKFDLMEFMENYLSE